MKNKEKGITEDRVEQNHHVALKTRKIILNVKKKKTSIFYFTAFCHLSIYNIQQACQNMNEVYSGVTQPDELRRVRLYQRVLGRDGSCMEATVVSIRSYPKVSRSMDLQPSLHHLTGSLSRLKAQLREPVAENKNTTFKSDSEWTKKQKKMCFSHDPVKGR